MKQIGLRTIEKQIIMAVQTESLPVQITNFKVKIINNKILLKFGMYKDEEYKAYKLYTESKFIYISNPLKEVGKERILVLFPEEVKIIKSK